MNDIRSPESIPFDPESQFRPLPPTQGDHVTEPTVPTADQRRGVLESFRRVGPYLAPLAVIGGIAVGVVKGKVDSGRAAEATALEASASPTSESHAKSKMAVVPRLVQEGERLSLLEAKAEVKEVGFLQPLKVLLPPKLKRLPPPAAGREYVASQLVQKVPKVVTRGGKRLKISVTVPLKAGKQLPKTTQLYVKPKQVLIGTRPEVASPLPSPDTPVTAPLPVINPVPPGNTGPITPPVETPPNPGETLNVTAEIERIQKEDTLYDHGSGCSATVIRNDNGEALGVSSAKHCLAQAERVLQNGKTYLVVSSNLFSRGEDVNHLQPFATSSEAFVPKPDNITSDEVIFSFSGKDLDEVRSAYAKKHITSAQIANLRPGVDTLYLSGYPVRYGNYQPSVTRRINQDYLYLGRGTIPTYSGQNINESLAMGCNPTTQAPCASPGTSGAEYRKPFIVTDSRGLKKVVMYFAGTATAFDNLNDPNGDAVRQSRKRDFNMPDLSDRFSFFSYSDSKIPTPDGYERVKIVTSRSQIPS